MEYEIEKVWNYKGYECIVIKMRINKPNLVGIANHLDITTEWRCGYVGVNNLNPNGDDKFYENNINCHGGVVGVDRMNITGVENNYLAFHCHHYRNTPDKCTLDYCIKECESIVDQLIKLEK